MAINLTNTIEYYSYYIYLRAIHHSAIVKLKLSKPTERYRLGASFCNFYVDLLVVLNIFETVWNHQPVDADGWNNELVFNGLPMKAIAGVVDVPTSYVKDGMRRSTVVQLKQWKMGMW